MPKLCTGACGLPRPPPPPRELAAGAAAVLCLRAQPRGPQDLRRLEQRHGPGTALPGLVHHPARAVYDRLKRATAFAMPKLLQPSGSGASEPDASQAVHGRSLARALS